MTNSSNSNKTYETSALCTTCQHSEVCKLREEYMRILTTITQPTDCPFTVELKCPHHYSNYVSPQLPQWTPGVRGNEFYYGASNLNESVKNS